MPLRRQETPECPNIITLVGMRAEWRLQAFLLRQDTLGALEILGADYHLR
jgi:hypothetical protein